MNAPISFFCAGVNSSALAGAPVQATPRKAAARPNAVVSFIRLSRLRPRLRADRPYSQAASLRATIATLLWPWTLFLADFRDRVFPRDGAEPGHLGVELKLDRSGRPVALLTDYDFRPPVGRLHLRHPGDVFLRAGPRLLVLKVIFLPVDEHHDVSVLFDRT